MTQTNFPRTTNPASTSNYNPEASKKAEANMNTISNQDSQITNLIELVK